MLDVFLLVDGGLHCVKVLEWLYTRVCIFLLILVEIVLSVFAYQFCYFFLKGVKHFLMDSLQSVILFVQQWRYNLTATRWRASDICRPLIHLGHEPQHTERDILVSVQDAWKLFCCKCHKDLSVFYRILCFLHLALCNINQQNSPFLK